MNCVFECMLVFLVFCEFLFVGESYNSVIIFGLCPNILFLQRNFKLIILGKFL